MLGLFALNAQGIQGGILQMINHGLSTGALFLMVGMIYERRHTREMDAFGGLWKVMPVYGVLTLIVALSSMGLPGLNGFVGEFTILLGAWGAGQPGGALGSLLVCRVWLRWVSSWRRSTSCTCSRRLFLGPVDKDENRSLKDLNWREIVTLVPLLVFIFWIGLYPQAVLRPDGAGGGQAGGYAASSCSSGACTDTSMWSLHDAWRYYDDLSRNP